MSRTDTNTGELSQAITARLGVMRIIAGALITGAVGFAAVSLFLKNTAEPDPAAGSFPIVSTIGLAATLVQSLLVVILPGAAARNLVSKAETSSQLVEAYFGPLLMTFALLEGATFFNCVAYIIEGQWWTLVAVGTLIVWMLTQFPTRTRVEHWIETQQMNVGSPSPADHR
jgi:hypothetical protein